LTDIRYIERFSGNIVRRKILYDLSHTKNSVFKKASNFLFIRIFNLKQRCGWVKQQHNIIFLKYSILVHFRHYRGFGDNSIYHHYIFKLSV